MMVLASEPCENTESVRTDINVPWTKTRSYINRSSVNVVVLDRNNIPTIVNGNDVYFHAEGDFVIVDKYVLRGTKSNDACFDYIKEYQKYHTTEQKELSIFYRALKAKKESSSRLEYFELYIEYTVKTRHLKERNSFYLTRTDVVLGRHFHDVYHHHPFSDIGLAKGTTDKVMTELESACSGFSMMIDIVDNESKIRDRYFTYNDRLIAIQTRKDSTKKSGVYITEALRGEDGKLKIKHDVIELDNISTAKFLYETEEDAKCYGNKQLALEKEIADQKLEIIRLSHDGQKKKEIHENNSYDRKEKNSQDTHQYEAIRTEAQIAFERQKKENEELKFKNEKKSKKLDRKLHKLNQKKVKTEDKRIKRNDYYDQRSMERKDSHELIKFIPAAIVGFLGLYALVNRNSGK